MPRRPDTVTNRYLDQVLEDLKLPSHYALADVLGVTTQAVYKMRGGGAMSTTTAAKVAELLELEPLSVIAELELERGSDPELWKRIAKSAAAGLVVTSGAALLALLGIDLTITEFVSAFVAAVPLGAGVNTHCLLIVAAALLTAGACHLARLEDA